MLVSPEIKFGVKLARKAGENILKAFSINVERKWKSDQTPVTAADLRNNELALEEISREFPGITVIAEEKSLLQGLDEDVVAVVDPLDGTIPFIYGIPTCVFSFSLVARGIPFVAVVYDPFLDRMFTAQRGHGTFLNDTRIYVTSQQGFEKMIFGIGWIREQINLILLQEALIKKGSYLISLLTSIYSGALVSCGSFAASIYPVKFPWDGASVKLLVEEAGGKVTDLFGNEQRWDREIVGCLAANPWLHERLVKLINDLVIR